MSTIAAKAHRVLFSEPAKTKNVFTCRASQSYYRVYIRENFVTWSDEADPDKINALISKAQSDADFILHKVLRFYPSH
jgi:hypothetical protein